ncbi:hypothetical protein HNQ07_004046 [Deinococcus metalli]|uniref:Uncharacterized protein n=1 Tax=Deinococcus metalli TaxID=1141878 RepID=A0A7W8KL39_9DEIO|nr:hypothetical protein [Deinococcus metalli]MBB5378539.1 hypothetical protein [Deinococcus metalli]GHF58434.1 hypothetical protein GCM10017781_38400 [Deinococcus metalli]
MRGPHRNAALLVPANGVIDLAAAVMAGRHQHLALVPLYGVLGVCMLVAHVRRWRWIPGAWDVVGLGVGLGLALGFLVTEWLAAQ